MRDQNRVVFEETLNAMEGGRNSVKSIKEIFINKLNFPLN